MTHLLPSYTPQTSALINAVHNLDCFDLLARLPDGSIDAIISDLPYGQVACSWDTIIPFAPMWAAVKRVLKPRGVFVTTASQPFTSALVMSNPKWFRYEWIWEKNVPTGFLNAYKQPMKYHENVVVFAAGQSSYYPLRQQGVGYRVIVNSVKSQLYGRQRDVVSVNDGSQYLPSSIIGFDNENGGGKSHPTQKPVALYEYLIRTYTQPNDIVLDFCCGSGTTALAARNTGRRFIVGNSDAEYCKIARDRLRMPFDPREHVKEAPPLSDLPLFAAIGD